MSAAMPGDGANARAYPGALEDADEGKAQSRGRRRVLQPQQRMAVVRAPVFRIGAEPTIVIGAATAIVALFSRTPGHISGTRGAST